MYKLLIYWRILLALRPGLLRGSFQPRQEFPVHAEVSPGIAESDSGVPADVSGLGVLRL